MAFKDLRIKFKKLMLRGLLKREHEREGRGSENVKKPSWMMPISHGYYVVEGRSWEEEPSESVQPDSVVVQREETSNLELWFYSLSDSTIGDSISGYLQSQLFGRKVEESQVRRKSKEVLRKAYLNAKARVESGTLEETASVGSASVIVINREKVVMAQMGGYRAIVCRDGVAHQLHAKHQRRGKRHLPRRLISGAVHISKVRIQACHSGRDLRRKQANSSELIATAEKIDAETEFLILASTAVLEVMKNQEAVDLIWHIDDPQEAAECLAREASIRMSRNNISCVVIRFDYRL